VSEHPNSPAAGRRLSPHPGGLGLTKKMAAFCHFAKGDKVLDVGCGAGETVRFLRETHQLDAMGIDPALTGAREQADPNLPIWRGTADALPFEEESLDGILCECSFSLFDRPESVLAGFARVLKPGGRLLISDVYARGRPAEISGFTKHLHTRESLCQWAADQGLELILFEDQSQTLKSLALQMIMDAEDGESFYENIGVSFAEMKAARCGYYLLIARKPL
jgi:ubiquinone/menaquinone biosynthesis C-methylase UbiE